MNIVNTEKTISIGNRKFTWLFVLVTGGVIFLDQIVKLLVVRFTPNLTVGFFRLQLIYNTGAGFGIFQGMSFILGILSLIVALGILYFYSKIESNRYPQMVWGMFLGGVIGNMIDRLVRQRVVDFIFVWIWPAFNLADMMLTISAICLVGYYWRKK